MIGRESHLSNLSCLLDSLSSTLPVQFDFVSCIVSVFGGVSGQSPIPPLLREPNLATADSILPIFIVFAMLFFPLLPVNCLSCFLKHQIRFLALK